MKTAGRLKNVDNFNLNSRMKKIWERKIPLSKAKGRDWDIQFWQAQGADARFKAAWTMIIDFFKLFYFA